MKDTIISYNYSHTFPTKNGIVDETSLEFAKKTFLFDTVRNLSHIVRTQSRYPENDSTTVDMFIDVVIMDRQKYDELTGKINLPNLN